MATGGSWELLSEKWELSAPSLKYGTSCEGGEGGV